MAHAQSVAVDVTVAEATTAVVVAAMIVADAAVTTVVVAVAMIVAVQAATTVALVASQTVDQSLPSQLSTMPSP